MAGQKILKTISRSHRVRYKSVFHYYIAPTSPTSKMDT